MRANWSLFVSISSLLTSGGIVTTFAVFAVSFALAAGAAFLLPEKRDAGID